MGKHNLSALDCLRRARIHVQKYSPFFGILARHLKFHEVPEEFMEMPAGVDVHGNFYYKKAWVESLSDEELQGLVIHETEHCAFLHILRLGKRNPDLWNVSTDVIVNNIAIRNGYRLPKGGLIPTNNQVQVNGEWISDLDKLSAEELYEKLEKILDENKGGKGKGRGDNDNSITIRDYKVEGAGKGFDEHMFKPKDGKELTDEEKRQIQREWIRRTREAVVLAKTKGNLPVGVELLVDKLQRSQIDWKSLLLRNVQSVIPYDYSYCLESGTKIKTPRGTIPIQKLRQGRYILGLKDNCIVYSKIKRKWKTNVKLKYIITTKKGKKIICSSEHKILMKNRKYIKSKGLKVGDNIIITK
jgi:predicted metal-dependent peptidase